MRLMQVMAGGPQGGAEAFFERLAIALRAPDMDQLLAIRRDPERAARLRAAGLTVSEHTFGGRLDLSTPWQLRRLARRFQPDVTLAWMNRGTRMAPAKPGVLLARLGGYYSLKYYRHCRHLIGNTRDIVDYLVRSGWPADRAHYLPNFVTASDAEPESRAAHDTPADAPLLLALGRFHRNKGFDVLLAALTDVPGAVLWLAGAGPEETRLRQQAIALGIDDRVRWLGWRQDVGPLYRACDVFVCPSRHEPLGNVVIEAWAHRAAVVAADASGPASLLADRETGRLVPRENPAALATALAETLTQPAEAAAIAEAGHQAFAAQFSEAVVVRQYRDFLQSVLR